MSIWSYLPELIAWVNPLREPPDPTRTGTFTIGVIALAAKIAKADGRVTRDEVAAFRTLFHVDPEDETRVAQVYDFFRQDPDHYQYYARQLKRLLKDQDILGDILDALFAIAMADGEFHRNEEEFLRTCGEIFEMDETRYRTLQSRWVPERWDPWAVLEMRPTPDMPRVQARYRDLVRISHPDVMMSRGVPVEMIGLANQRIADLNRAYEDIREAAAP